MSHCLINCNAFPLHSTHLSSPPVGLRVHYVDVLYRLCLRTFAVHHVLGPKAKQLIVQLAATQAKLKALSQAATASATGTTLSPIPGSLKGGEDEDDWAIVTVTEEEAAAATEQECVERLVEMIPEDDVQLDCLRAQAQRQFPELFPRLLGPQEVRHLYNAGLVLRVIKVQRAWRMKVLTKLARVEDAD